MGNWSAIGIPKTVSGVGECVARRNSMHIDGRNGGMGNTA